MGIQAGTYRLGPDTAPSSCVPTNGRRAKAGHNLRFEVTVLERTPEVADDPTAFGPSCRPTAARCG